MVSKERLKAFELKCEKLGDLAESYSDNQNYCLATSLASYVLLFDFGCQNFEEFIAKKTTPLNEK